MFNNTNPETNGERRFFNSIKENCSIIFDVGSSVDSIFLNDNIEIHYFEPLKRNLDNLIIKENKNINPKFNCFGLSDVEETLKYYDNHGSLINRSEKFSKTPSYYSGIDVLVKRGDEYVNDNNITKIDFLKLDVEGYELKVLKGFGDKLKMVKYIQFEYGSGTADADCTMLDLVNYLREFGFTDFSYLSGDGLIPINDFSDHWNFCNIMCVNSKNNDNR